MQLQVGAPRSWLYKSTFPERNQGMYKRNQKSEGMNANYIESMKRMFKKNNNITMKDQCPTISLKKE